MKASCSHARSRIHPLYTPLGLPPPPLTRARAQTPRLQPRPTLSPSPRRGRWRHRGFDGRHGAEQVHEQMRLERRGVAMKLKTLHHAAKASGTQPSSSFRTCCPMSPVTRAKLSSSHSTCLPSSLSTRENVAVRGYLPSYNSEAAPEWMARRRVCCSARERRCTRVPTLAQLRSGS